MHQLFVFGTLKHRKTQKEALGHEVKYWTDAVAPGLVERYVGSYPTLDAGDGQVKGEILVVSSEELKKLDKWEAKYERREITTDHGPAWAYILK